MPMLIRMATPFLPMPGFLVPTSKDSVVCADAPTWQFRALSAAHRRGLVRLERSSARLAPYGGDRPTRAKLAHSARDWSGQVGRPVLRASFQRPEHASTSRHGSSGRRDK